MVMSCWPSGMRSPLGSTSEPAPAPPPDSFMRLATVKRPGLSALSTTISTDHRAHEVVALGAGVLAGGLAQLGVEGLVDVGERRHDRGR